MLVGQRKQALVFFLCELLLVDLGVHDLRPVDFAVHG
jgi:hypothetical protein